MSRFLRLALCAAIALSVALTGVNQVIAKGESNIVITAQIDSKGAVYPEVFKLDDGRIAGLLSMGEEPEGPNGPNDPGPCHCTGYVTSLSGGIPIVTWASWTTPGCFPNEILGCRDCCQWYMNEIGPFNSNY